MGKRTELDSDDFPNVRKGGLSMAAAKVLLAMAATELSEGQACKALGLDRVSLRKMRDDTVAEGVALAERFLQVRRTSEESAR